MIAVATGVAAAALSVSPARVRLTAAGSRTITITNAGDAATVVNVQPGALVVDRRGKPAIGRNRTLASGWLRVRPRQLVVPVGGAAAVTVSAVTAAAALPGDHAALVLLTTRPPRRVGVGVQLRIGVVVLVRVPGRVVHRLEIGALRARRRVLDVAIANRGNVVERTRVRISLSSRGRVVARLRSVWRTLLPHSRLLERVRYPRRIRGRVTARVEMGVRHRSFRIQL